MTATSLGTWTKTSVKVGVLSAGVLLVGGTGAHAADNWNTSFNSGIGSGNQIKLPVQAPINICGIAIGILGNANASCTGGSEANYGEDALATDWSSFGNSGILSGNQVLAPIQVPIDACGVGVGVLGSANAWCVGGSEANLPGVEPGDVDEDPYPQPYGEPSWHQHQGKNKKKKDFVSTAAPIESTVAESSPLDVITGLLPINGLTSGLTGAVGNTSASVGIGAKQQQMQQRLNQRKKWQHSAPSTCDLNWNTFGNSGILSGNQVFVPVQAPIDVSGVAVGALLGNANASSVGGSTANFC
ncbi:chaplin family protein [Catellatospora citrea]|uniref:Chaplin domain-containing protein n=1 Tax=Catellatospora citrea TaxID=53366 RepID=A0A8J3P3K3_9ACTN|nr:chaplin family protein [Catellatospora citrea]RKE08822.1 small secreted domain DUF320 [Catellatospora citrea]GIG02447.1 hypothetical protein Cci01nite_75400 [Catellatospora citrea]